MTTKTKDPTFLALVEPGCYAEGPSDWWGALASIAISQKRIADSLDRIARALEAHRPTS